MHLTDELELSCQETSQILLAGRVATAPVALHDGATTEVLLTFE
jgi:hypothetical protein